MPVRTPVSVVAIVSLPFVLLAAWLAGRSSGVYEDDCLTHFQMARWAWEDPRFLLHIWGRPGFTVPHAAVAWIGDVNAGWLASRLLSVTLATIAAAAAGVTAARLGITRPWVATLSVWLMPLYFATSYANLTETACAAYLALGTCLLTYERFRLAAVILAIAPLARYEAVLGLAPVGVFLLMRRQWTAAALLAWAFVLWEVATAIALPGWVLPHSVYLSPQRTAEYGWGGPLHYVLMWTDLATVPGVALTIAGAAVLIHPASKLVHPWADARGFVRWLAAGGALGSIALFTWIYMTSPFASGGYARFLLPACPWMGVCVAAAVARLIEAVQLSLVQPLRVMLTTFALAGVVAFAALYVDAATMWGTFSWRLTGYTLLAVWTCAAALPVLAGLAWVARGPAVRGVVAVAVLLMAAAVALPWAERAQSFRLRPEQLALRNAVATALNAAEPQNVVGLSPWVAHFAGSTWPIEGSRAIDRWQGGETGLVFIYDSVLCNPHTIALDELKRVPHTELGRWLLGNRFVRDPYLVVLKRR